MGERRDGAGEGRGIGVGPQVLNLRAHAGPRVREHCRTGISVGCANAREVIRRRAHDAVEPEPAGFDNALHEGDVAPDAFVSAFLDEVARERHDRNRCGKTAGGRLARVEPRDQLLRGEPGRAHDRYGRRLR